MEKILGFTVQNLDPPATESPRFVHLRFLEIFKQKSCISGLLLHGSSYLVTTAWSQLANEDIAPHIFNFGPTWRCMGIFTTRLHYRQECSRHSAYTLNAVWLAEPVWTSWKEKLTELRTHDYMFCLDSDAVKTGNSKGATIFFAFELYKHCGSDWPAV